MGARNRVAIGCRTGPPEPEFVNVKGALELIPRNRFRQAVNLGSVKGLQIRALAT
jgi:hypothetical protein